MTISERHQRIQPVKPDQANARLLSEFKKATLRGDPITVYQVILHCNDHQIAPPEWLTEHLLELIADYHLGHKPSWKGAGNRPLIVIRRRFEAEIKRRAVTAVRAWIKDRSQYQAMPTKCIQMWNQQDYRHCEFKNDADALDFASVGLKGIKVQENGPELKCSPRTLRRAMETKYEHSMPALSRRIAKVFGLADPDSFFGYDNPLNDHLK